jgi:hypothetical protein
LRDCLDRARDRSFVWPVIEQFFQGTQASKEF